MGGSPLHISAGDRFGRLIVVREDEPRKYARQTVRIMFCRCDCGAEKTAILSDLRSGRTKSCGCYNREDAARRHFVHGDGKKGQRAPEYLVYHAMLARCLNLKNNDFHLYGGRGITVCDRWRENYSHFIADMGRRPSADHSIDRIDNDGPYSPDNCQWATAREQRINQRRMTMVQA